MSNPARFVVSFVASPLRTNKISLEEYSICMGEELYLYADLGLLNNNHADL